MREIEELEAEQEEDEMKAEITAEMRESFFGNVTISLMWEEKVVLILRYCQFYGFLLLIFFENWPDNYQSMSGFLFLMSGQWNLLIGGQEAWYNMI